MADGKTRSLDIQPLTPCLGAEVAGIDLTNLDATEFQSLHAAFLKYKVLVFRDQQLTRDAQKNFGRHFGQLQTHPAKTHLGAKGDPEIFEINITERTHVANGELWHTDLSCEPIPPLASILYITEVPPSGGGDTLFANMNQAYTSLSEPIQNALLDFTAFHSGEKDLKAYGYSLKPGQTYPSSHHPVVTEHPETGEPILFVNEAFTDHIENLTPSESDAWLNMLYRHIERNTRLHCRVKWQRNTVVMWDNRAVHHHAVWDYYPETRRGERVTVKCPSAPNAYRRPS